jgi:hypothetical protein
VRIAPRYGDARAYLVTMAPVMERIEPVLEAERPSLVIVSADECRRFVATQ